jgi:hypothetical protein
VRRRLHLAGSAKADADVALLSDAHAVAAAVAEGWLARGGSLVAGIGAEPAHASRPDLSLIFDWTVIAAVASALHSGGARGEAPALILRGSRRAYDQVPAERVVLLDKIRAAGALELELLPDTWRSGALVRRSQASVGEVLVMLSGGAGVEDLANLYAAERRPIVPIDVDLGSSRNDGAQRGGTGLARRALADPGAFIRLADGTGAGARLAALVMGPTRPPPAVLAERALALLDDLERPRAFYVRLLDTSHPDWRSVESFFRDVADPVLDELGLCVIDLGRDPQRQAWMNAEIFEELYTAHTVIADLTGQRPNCYLELGFALAGGPRTIITAKAGEAMTFDTDKLPWHFWDPAADATVARDALRDHIGRFGSRSPLVTPVRMV